MAQQEDSAATVGLRADWAASVACLEVLTEVVTADIMAEPRAEARAVEERAEANTVAVMGVATEVGRREVIAVAVATTVESLAVAVAVVAVAVDDEAMVASEDPVTVAVGSPAGERMAEAKVAAMTEVVPVATMGTPSPSANFRAKRPKSMPM